MPLEPGRFQAENPTRGFLRVRVDASRCDGQGVCKTVAPELFELDRYGYAYSSREARDLDPGDFELIEIARVSETMCPRAAIFLERVQTASPATERLAPDPDPPAWLGGGRLLRPGSEAESLAEWEATGGFRRSEPGQLAAAATQFGLLGQGGAAFPAARKWAVVPSGKAIVVVNGAEREPGTVKDGYLLAQRPFLVLDGALAVAHETGAQRVVLAVPDGDEALTSALEAAAEQVAERGLNGDIRLEVRTVPATYVAGEETALLAALQDQPAIPRLRPPYPVTSGLYGGPTIVHNVETVAKAALLDAFGPTGVDDWPTGGTGLFSVGWYGGESFRLIERPMGASLRDLLSQAGVGAKAVGVLVGGYAGGMLRADQLDVGLSDPDLAAVGARLGTKSVQVLGAGTCPLSVVVDLLGFFSRETARQCPPCYRGLPDMRRLAQRLHAGQATEAEVEDFRQFMATTAGRNICALPDGAAGLVLSYFRNFEADLDQHRQGGCPQG